MRSGIELSQFLRIFLSTFYMFINTRVNMQIVWFLEIIKLMKNNSSKNDVVKHNYS